MVAMDREDYMDKAQLLLADTNTCKPITKNSTNRLENKLSQALRDIKNHGELNDHINRKVYLSVQLPLNFMADLKHIKLAPPQTHCLLEKSITYGVAKELAKIICPLVDQSPHNVKNTQHFAQHFKEVSLEPGEVMTSYDVKALITSVPMAPAINIVKLKLQWDPFLPQRTNISIPEIITLLKFCLKNTYFLFQGKYYKQVHGSAMSSPISLPIANLFMEDFKVKALNSAPHPLSVAKVCG